MNTSDCSILIVDDVPENLKLLASILRSKGHAVRVAPSGELALRSVEHKAPDLILLDIRMPGIDGFEVCRRLKSDPDTESIPVIFLSAQHDDEHRIRGFREGAADFVTKPFSAEEVCARVQTHLRLSGALRALAEKTEQAEDQLQRLRRTERARDELTRMIVHDMRTPLMAILLIAEGLVESVPEEHHEEAVDLVSSGRRLETMVQSVLDTGKLEHGKMPIEPETLDLASTVASAIRSTRRLGYEIDIETDLEPELWLRADPALVLRTLENLLVNALKYSPDDGRVVVGARRGDDRALIWVRDTGPGIPTSQRESLFDPFVGGHDTSTPSWGLGLSFCRLAVEAQGGEIGLTDGPDGVGSEFWFSLPVAAPETVTSSPPPSHLAQ